jgi:uncharacterized protein (DUF2147 family)
MLATWNMVTRTGLAALAWTLGTAGIAAAAPKDPSGTWLTEDGRARIRVEKCGARQSNLCGYVVWMKTPLTDAGEPRLDRRNPDPNKTSRPLLGHQLMMGLRANGDENYQGLIYNNEDGKSYNVTVWVEDAGVLKVKGCLVAFLCSTQDWTRAGDVLPGQLAGVTGSANGPKPDPEWAPKPVAAGGPGQGETVKADARPKPRP